MSSQEFYRRWRNGEIYFGTERIEFPQPTDKDKVFKVNWDSLPPDEQYKIEIEQKELFDKRVERKLSELKENFIQKTVNSRALNDFKKNEVLRIKKILFKAPPSFLDMDKLILFGDLVFLHNDILDIQYYVKNYILNTPEFPNYRFILAEKFPYQNENFIQNEVYAETLWQYKEWMESNNDMPINKNPFPLIFTNENAYEFFTFLQENFIQSIQEINNGKMDKRYSEYGLLYKYLKDEYYIHDITQRKFISFLRDNYELSFTINYDQFKIRENHSKRKLFNHLKDKFS